MRASRPIDPAVADRLGSLAGGGPQPTSWEDVRQAVEQVLATVEDDPRGGDLKLLAEVRGLARYIDQIKGEIAALRGEESSLGQIPTATDGLDAVVCATEKATEAIMGAAETIEYVARSLDPQRSAALTGATTMIYEACSFQDITGQRIAKVVNALTSIERKLAQMINSFGTNAQGDAGAAARPARPQAAGKPGASPEGPQRPGEANSQDDIDALLASLE